MYNLMKPPCAVSPEEHELSKRHIKNTENSIDQRQSSSDESRKGTSYESVGKKLHIFRRLRGTSHCKRRAIGRKGNTKTAEARKPPLREHIDLNPA